MIKFNGNKKNPFEHTLAHSKISGYIIVQFLGPKQTLWAKVIISWILLIILTINVKIGPSEVLTTSGETYVGHYFRY
jgi:hypothetical protein